MFEKQFKVASGTGKVDFSNQTIDEEGNHVFNVKLEDFNYENLDKAMGLEDPYFRTFTFIKVVSLWGRIKIFFRKTLKKEIRFKIRIPDGMEIPFGYGIAFYDPTIRARIVMPIPFNVIYSKIRGVYLWFVYGYMKKADYEYLEGYHDAIEQLLKRGRF